MTRCHKPLTMQGRATAGKYRRLARRNCLGFSTGDTHVRFSVEIRNCPEGHVSVETSGLLLSEGFVYFTARRRAAVARAL